MCSKRRMPNCISDKTSYFQSHDKAFWSWKTLLNLHMYAYWSCIQYVNVVVCEDSTWNILTIDFRSTPKRVFNIQYSQLNVTILDERVTYWRVIL